MEKELHLMGCDIGEDFDDWTKDHIRPIFPGNQSFAQYLALYLERHGKHTIVYASQTGANLKVSSPTGKYTEEQVWDLLKGPAEVWKTAIAAGDLKVEYYSLYPGGYSQFPIK